MTCYCVSLCLKCVWLLIVFDCVPVCFLVVNCLACVVLGFVIGCHSVSWCVIVLVLRCADGHCIAVLHVLLVSVCCVCCCLLLLSLCLECWLCLHGCVLLRILMQHT